MKMSLATKKYIHFAKMGNFQSQSCNTKKFIQNYQKKKNKLNTKNFILKTKSLQMDTRNTILSL